MGEFKKSEAEELLVACHRRCCICHKFCASRMELDHMSPASLGGSDNIDDAIPLCFDCHAEAHYFNDKHPKGRKFSPRELRLHKEQWLRVCRETPAALLDAPRFENPGPLETILWELRLDLEIASVQDTRLLGCTFELEQLKRAIATGALLGVPDAVAVAVRSANVLMGAANNSIAPLGSIGHHGDLGNAQNRAQQTLVRAKAGIQAAIVALEAL
jgi:hypothetical protein